VFCLENIVNSQMTIIYMSRNTHSLEVLVVSVGLGEVESGWQSIAPQLER
jgi:hypothetical protein